MSVHFSHDCTVLNTGVLMWQWITGAPITTSCWGVTFRSVCCAEGPDALGEAARRYLQRKAGWYKQHHGQRCHILPNLSYATEVRPGFMVPFNLQFTVTVLPHLCDNDLWDHSHLRGHLCNDLLVTSKIPELCLSLDYFLLFHQSASSLCSHWVVLKLLAISFTKRCQHLWKHLFFPHFLGCPADPHPHSFYFLIWKERNPRSLLLHPLQGVIPHAGRTFPYLFITTCSAIQYYHFMCSKLHHFSFIEENAKWSGSVLFLTLNKKFLLRQPPLRNQGWK